MFTESGICHFEHQLIHRTIGKNKVEAPLERAFKGPCGGFSSRAVTFLQMAWTSRPRRSELSPGDSSKPRPLTRTTGW
jgi:hypothetical protein